jgi:hypothetical protein
MSVTQDYKLHTAKILDSECIQSPNDNHALDLSGPGSVQSLDVVEQLRRDRIPLFVRQMRADDKGHLIGNRVYVLQDLFKLGAHFASLKKNEKCIRASRAAKEAVTIIAGCTLIMSGPILSALGVIKG